MRKNRNSSDRCKNLDMVFPGCLQFHQPLDTGEVAGKNAEIPCKSGRRIG